MLIRITVLLVLAGFLTGCSMESPGERFALKPAWTSPTPGTDPITSDIGTTIWVQAGPIITAADIKSCEAIMDSAGRPAIKITLNRSGAARIKRFSSGHVNEPVAIFIDGQLLSTPYVRAEMEGEFEINGFFEQAEVDQMVTSIREVMTSN